MTIDLSSIDTTNESPYMCLALPSVDDGKRILDRSILARSLYELWIESSSFDNLCEELSRMMPDEKMPYTSEDATYKVVIDAFNRSYSKRSDERLQKIEKLVLAFDFKGRVQLKDPQHVFQLLEYYSNENHGDQPDKVYFVRLLADGCKESLTKKYDLTKRCFIGNTSMDPIYAMIAANMVGCKNGDVVLDPFVGTGSLLVACAHYGAYVLGTDINAVLLHGRGKSSRHNARFREADESIRSNLRQYDLESRYLDVLVADASKHSMWCRRGLFDAIVTDPPYGIREQTKKQMPPAPDEKKPYFMPAMASYQLSDVFRDLLNFAADYLRLHGRLCFWLPIYRPDYTDQSVPSHPCLRLVSNSEQVLSKKISRRLITMEKTDEPESLCCSQDCHVNPDGRSNGAAFADDHYKSSFRDRYFRSSGAP